MRGVQAGVGSWKLLVWNTERRCRLVRTPGSQPLLDPTAAPSVSQSRFCLRVEGNFSHFREMCQHLMKCLLSHLLAAGVVVQTCHTCHTWPRDHVTLTRLDWPAPWDTPPCPAAPASGQSPSRRPSGRPRCWAPGSENTPVLWQLQRSFLKFF